MLGHSALCPVNKHSTLQQRRLLQPIRGTTCAARICAVARLRIHRQNQTVRPRGACLCKEAVMITIRLQCLVLRRYGVEDANWSHPIFPPVTTATILAARNFFHHHDPGGLSEPSVGVAKSCWEPTNLTW